MAIATHPRFVLVGDRLQLSGVGVHRHGGHRLRHRGTHRAAREPQADAHADVSRDRATADRG